MGKGRLEAFSDGVIAIIITIMVLELKAPHAADLASLIRLVPTFLCYGLSFIFVGIYWTNHHHLFHFVHHVNGKILWANLHLLFWLSLTPFVTAWIAESSSSSISVAAYGTVMLLSGVGYYILVQALLHASESHRQLANAIGKDRKGILSIVLYALALPLAFINTVLAYGIFIAVALMWLIPDRRIEKHISGPTKG